MRWETQVEKDLHLPSAKHIPQDGDESKHTGGEDDHTGNDLANHWPRLKVDLSSLVKTPQAHYLKCHRRQE